MGILEDIQFKKCYKRMKYMKLAFLNKCTGSGSKLEFCKKCKYYNPISYISAFK